MEFQEFIDRMKDELEGAYADRSPGTTVLKQQIDKLQGESYTALTVTPPDAQAAVTLNMDALYAELQDGHSFSSLVDEALGRAESGMQEAASFDPTRLTDYDDAKGNLVVDVVGTEANAALLAGVPHTDIEDMSMVYRLQVESLGGTTLVTNGLMNAWGITQDELHEDALKSAPEVWPAEVKTMSEMMAEIMGVPPEMMPAPAEGEAQIYVVTNEEKFRGAGALFYPDLLEDCAKQMGGDFFVLPSSVHEMLIIPDDGKMKSADLDQMVSTVNAEAVSAEDQLTDHAYHYDAAEKLFERTDRYEERMEAREEEADREPGRKPEKEEHRSVLEDLRSKKEQIPEKAVRAEPAVQKNRGAEAR